LNVTARSRRVPLTGATLAVAALLAAGCSPSSSSSTTGSASAPAASTPAGSASPVATSSAGAASSPTAAATPSSGSGSSASGAHSCATNNLHAAVAGGEGAAGSNYLTIDFTNTGGSSCTLYGYPGMSLANSGGPIGASATRDPSHAATLVTLAPGGKANAVLRVVDAQNYPSGTCSPDSSSFLLIYPPNQTQATDVPYKSTGCKNSSVKLLTVGVVTAGAGSG
jgi:Protein of unknown function (DUF4232)